MCIRDRSIGAEAFSNTKIKSITLPKTLKELGVYVFYGCKKLDNITMPGKIKNIERIYSECEEMCIRDRYKTERNRMYSFWQ